MYDWNNANVLKLISEIEKRPLLWDTKDRNFKSNLKKQKEVKNIASIMNTTGPEIIRKFNIIKGQLRRELRKMEKSQKIDPNNEYNSVWFAFSSLTFLCKDKINIKNYHSLSFENSPLSNNEDKTSIKYESNGITSDTEDQLKYNSPNNNSDNHQTKDLHNNNSDNHQAKDIDVSKSPHSVISNRDDLDLYGEYVVSRLRKITDQRTQLSVQRDIDNILYNALLLTTVPVNEKNDNNQYIVSNNNCNIYAQDILAQALSIQSSDSEEHQNLSFDLDTNGEDHQNINFDLDTNRQEHHNINFELATNLLDNVSNGVHFHNHINQSIDNAME